MLASFYSREETPDLSDEIKDSQTEYEKKEIAKWATTGGGGALILAFGAVGIKGHLDEIKAKKKLGEYLSLEEYFDNVDYYQNTITKSVRFLNDDNNIKDYNSLKTILSAEELTYFERWKKSLGIDNSTPVSKQSIREALANRKPEALKNFHELQHQTSTFTEAPYYDSETETFASQEKLMTDDQKSKEEINAFQRWKERLGLGDIAQISKENIKNATIKQQPESVTKLLELRLQQKMKRNLIDYMNNNETFFDKHTNKLLPIDKIIAELEKLGLTQEQISEIKEKMTKYQIPEDLKQGMFFNDPITQEARAEYNQNSKGRNMRIVGVIGALTGAAAIVAAQTLPELKLSQDSSGTIRSRADLLRRFDRLERDLLALHQSR
ncbi:MAG: hypothetical protein H6618_04300 [Deltaproteobacteria bacterium]|nr:hypothetical protein [Deltaproteobacteria bacterium]